MAAFLEWAPDSLYNSSISTIVSHYYKFKNDIKIFPENAQFDIYYRLYSKGRLCNLAQEFSDIEVFSRVLRVNDKRHLLHNCFQAIMDHGQKISLILADCYCQLCCVNHAADASVKDKTIQLGYNLATKDTAFSFLKIVVFALKDELLHITQGFNSEGTTHQTQVCNISYVTLVTLQFLLMGYLNIIAQEGGFLSDAGWFFDAEKVYMACLQLCKQVESISYKCRALECCVRLLHVRNANCRYDEAEHAWKEAQRYLNVLPSHSKATLYAEYCALLFAQSLYDKAYHYCHLALEEVNETVSPKALVDIFRQCAKACVVKREFKKAELLIKYAVQYAKENFGVKHHKYSDALLDYGFYLLNVDYIFQAVQVYQAALDIRIAVFGGNNLHVAVAHEDLAYSSYVNEYSSGKFHNAKEHAETAINMITTILPKEHLCLASSKRVKALILEELAIDSHNKETENRLLHEAQDLHLASLALATKAFGENNVQTAKHYGNLGRLYQSMQRYKEAEDMHLKAICIKEKLLGKEDYEVALSIGHLASLYNYDMKKYEKAEKLYLRSIAIGRKLFGPSYSGLEYDYRGLIILYHALGAFDQAGHYSRILQEWNQLRDRSQAVEKKPLDIDFNESVQQVLDRFHHID